MEKKSVILLITVILLAGGTFFAYVYFFGGEKNMDFQQRAEEIFEENIGVSEIEEIQEVEENVLENEDPKLDDKEDVKEENDNNKEVEQEEKTPNNQEQEDLEVVSRLVSWGFSSASARDIDTVILHSSFNSLGGDQYDVDAIIDIYRQYGVSAHYIIGRDGTVYQLVREKDVSYHAGVSEVPDGRNNVNNFSIGIEIVGNYDDGFTGDQYRAVNDLIDDIKSRYDIEYVLGHDDIAPGRKTDPWNFDWNKLQ